MDAQVCVLYRGESTGEYECFETSVPLSGEIDIDHLQGDEIFWSTIRPLEVEVEPRSDYDGENRMLGLDLILSIGMQIYREENCQLIIELMDKPGQLKHVSRIIADLGGNVISVHHERANEGSDVNGCYLRLVLETKNYEHIEEIKKALIDFGFKLL